MTRGSMQYWQKRRAYRRLPRLRTIPKSKHAPLLFNIIGYKAGMSHLMAIDEAAKGIEVSRACTIVEIPNIEVYGIRLYSINRKTGYKYVAKEVYNKEAAQKAGIKKTKNDDTKLEAIKGKLNEFVEITALLAAYPKGIATGQHHVDKFESQIMGNTINEKFDYITKLLGKEIKAHDMFKNGEHIDITSVSKGKGWQGPIKRFGTARLFHKATQKTRHVAPLGSFGMGRVVYGVPQAGQTGYNYRTEHNKKIMKIGKKEETGSINPKSGFMNYGMVTNDYIVIDGSIVGPAKRLVRIRKSISYDDKSVKEPKITFIATTNKGI